MTDRIQLTAEQIQVIEERIRVADRANLTDDQVYALAVEDWTMVLARLWTVFGKVPSSGELRTYRENLGDVPIGLLEPAIEHLAENHKYGFPRIADVLQAVVTELQKVNIRLAFSTRWGLKQAIEQWYAQTD